MEGFSMSSAVQEHTSAQGAASTSTGTKYVYSFGGGKADGNGTMKDVLGGKGAGLAEMTLAGLPVPPGFTVVTSACRLYFQAGHKTPAEILKQKDEALAKLEEIQGQKLGDKQNPLLVS